MNYIKGWWWGGGFMDNLPPKKKNRISLNGRDTPIDLVTKASFRIAHIKDAQYSLNPDKSFLTVNLPKKSKRKDYVMPLYETLDELMEDVRQEMEFDQFESMDSVRLAAEYPNFFWNGMFHTLGKITVLDKELEKQGLLQRKRRRIKR